jgi:protein-disulfide isomerase
MTYAPITPASAEPPPARKGAGTVIVGIIATLGVALGAAALVVALHNGDKTGTDNAGADAAAEPATTPTQDTPPSAPPLTRDLLNVAGVALGPDGAALAEPDSQPEVRLDLFSDYMCPYCGQFELQMGEGIAELVDEGRLAVVIHPIAILDSLSSGTNYSTRAAAASYALAAEAPEAWGAFNRALFENQPAENTEGLTNEEITELAVAAGVSPDIAADLWSDADLETLGSITAAAGAGGVQGTPTAVLSTTTQEPTRWDGQTPLNEVVDQLADQ